MTGDDVDPVACLQPPHECQHLVGGEIEWMEREPEVVVFDEWEKAKRAVTRPFHHEVVVTWETIASTYPGRSRKGRSVYPDRSSVARSRSQERATASVVS